MEAKEFNRCIKRIACGDKRGIEKIYNRYHDRLQFFANLEVQNKQDAEDIATNVIDSILKNAHRYGYVEKPDAYMYRALTFAIINFKKKNDKYVYTELIDEIYPSRDSKVELRVDLKCYIEKLPKRQQDIIRLHYILGLTIEETAEFLNISVTVS